MVHSDTGLDLGVGSSAGPAYSKLVGPKSLTLASLLAPRDHVRFVPAQKTTAKEEIPYEAINLRKPVKVRTASEEVWDAAEPVSGRSVNARRWSQLEHDCLARCCRFRRGAESVLPPHRPCGGLGARHGRRQGIGEFRQHLLPQQRAPGAAAYGAPGPVPHYGQARRGEMCVASRRPGPTADYGRQAKCGSRRRSA